MGARHQANSWALTSSFGEDERVWDILASAAAGQDSIVSEGEPTYVKRFPCRPPPLLPTLKDGESSDDMERGESSSASVSGTSSDSAARVESNRCATFALTRWIILSLSISLSISRYTYLVEHNMSSIATPRRPERKLVGDPSEPGSRRATSTHEPRALRCKCA